MRPLALLVLLAGPAVAADRPNVLWLTSEDHGPQMGCYGDKLAVTPHADKLAARGMRYTRVWSNYPVCAPARTALISGLHPHASGGDHMRSLVPYPAGRQMFPQLLRAAGYCCTNNAKEDYNLAKPGRVWDASSRQAHYRDRRPAQPFFAVFNSEKSHESKVRTRPHTPILDPRRVRVPAYHPDGPDVRRDWAQYYDVVSQADADAGNRLAELEKAGLADDTIVFFFADHGPGLPRCKRWPYHSGLHVPLIVYVPPKWRHLAGDDYKPGGVSDRLVSFVDFAPTVLSLAGVEPPAWVQGRAFLGKHAAPPPAVLFGGRGRMDERNDLVRTATDGRFVYVRNYLPHLIYGQHIDYLFQMPTVKEWRMLHRAGATTPAQARFWGPKPAEELYDLAADPDEVNDLAADPAHRATLEKLRAAVRDHCRSVRDLGFLPEGERFARAAGRSPYDLARDGDRYPFDRVFAAAERAAGFDPKDVPALTASLSDPDAAVRWWAAVGLQVRGKDAVAAGAEGL
jgi:arylsulfatase A-like enzyme